jgi:Mor family transcriptional regulator
MRNKKWPESLLRMREVLTCHFPDVNDNKIDEVLIDLCDRAIGGGQEYMAKSDHVKRMLRDRQLWEAFNGNNHNELARRFNLTTRQVYSILEEQRELNSRQISLL